MRRVAKIIAIPLALTFSMTACTPSEPVPSQKTVSDNPNSVSQSPNATETEATAAPPFGQSSAVETTPQDYNPEGLTPEQQSMLTSIMDANSLVQLQDKPIDELSEMDKQLLNKYLLLSVLEQVDGEIKAGKADEVFNKIAINVSGLKYKGAPIPTGIWQINRATKPEFEEIERYMAGGVLWGATKVTITRVVTFAAQTSTPIEIKNRISYFMAKNGEDQWIILGMESHEG